MIKKTLPLAFVMLTSAAFALPKEPGKEAPGDVPAPKPSSSASPAPSASGAAAPASGALPAGAYSLWAVLPGNTADISADVVVNREGDKVTLGLGPNISASGTLSPAGDVSLSAPLATNTSLAFAGKLNASGDVTGTVKLMKGANAAKSGTFTLAPQKKTGQAKRKLQQYGGGKPVEACGILCQLDKAWGCLKDWTTCGT